MARRSPARMMLMASLAASAVGAGILAHRRKQARLTTQAAQAAAPTPAGAEWWEAPDGLFGYHWPADNPRATLLLQHGFGEHAGRYVDHFSRLVPELNAIGFDVFAFDMIGHGRSPGDRGVTDVGAMAQAQRKARAELATRGRPLFLFGHSLGGLVTALSVARDASNVRGVVLSSPALPVAAPLPLRAVAKMLARIAPGLGTVSLGDASGISRIPNAVEAYRQDPLVFQRRIPALTGVSALIAAQEVRDGAAAWRVPTLILHGTADRYTDARESQHLFDRLPAGDKHLELVKDARHELLNDMPRKRIEALLLDWLRQRAGGAS